jgi:hypothetical protein
VLYLHTDSLLYRCSPDDFTRYSIFEDLFSDVNGHLLSQKDRETSMMSLWEDEQMFAYSEVDFMSFQDILQQAGAVDGCASPIISSMVVVCMHTWIYYTIY